MWLQLVSLYVLLMMGGGLDAARNASHQPERPRATASTAGRLPEPPAMVVRVGDPAPNFSFEGYNGRWMRLHHLLDQGPVLLVFGAREAELRRLQRERGALLDMGVIPVAVMDGKPKVTRAAVQRLGLQFTVIADPRGVIADQFNVVDGGSVTPSWFVVDNRGKVRGLFRGGSSNAEYARACARSLALPMPGVAFPGAR